MAINKVVFGNEIQMDLTEDTATEDKVLEGETFHDRSGVLRSGSLVIPVQDVEVNGESVVNSEKIAEIDIPTADEQVAVDEFETYNGGLLSECKVALSPNQDLHGYPEPWVGGAGKNKLGLIFTKNPSSVVGMAFTHTESSFTLKGTSNSDAYNIFSLNYLPNFKSNTSYCLTAIVDKGSFNGLYISISFRKDGVQVKRVTMNTGSTLSAPFDDVPEYDEVRFILESIPASTQYDLEARIQIEEGNVFTTFAPYSNICPISGHTQVAVDVSDGQTTQEQVTVNLGGTYYSGTLDVVSGVLTVDKAKIIIDENSAIYNWNSPQSPWCGFVHLISNQATGRKLVKTNYTTSIDGNYSSWNAYSVNRDVYVCMNENIIGGRAIADMTAYLATHPLEVVYELATPTPIQLSPTMVKALVGENHLSAPLEGQEITESKYRELFTWDEVEEIAQKIADSKIDNLNTSYDTTFSSAFTEARYVKKIYGAPVLTALQIVLSGAPSITFNHQLIFSDSQTCCELIQFGSGARIGITDVAISQGSVTFTFDSPLTKAIGFRCRITNDFVS